MGFLATVKARSGSLASASYGRARRRIMHTIGMQLRQLSTRGMAWKVSSLAEGPRCRKRLPTWRSRRGARERLLDLGADLDSIQANR